MNTIDKIQDLILKKRFTAKKVLQETGLPLSALSDWKKDRYKPSVDAIIKLADYFNVTTDFLLGRTDTPAGIHTASDMFNENEKTLINNYRNINVQGQEKLLDYSFDLIGNEKYKKSNQHGVVEKEA